MYELVEEAGGAADRYRDDAAARGTGVHEDIERCIIDDYEPATPKGYQGINWLRHKGFVVEELEYTVWDPVRLLAGTVDGVGRHPVNRRHNHRGTGRAEAAPTPR